MSLAGILYNTKRVSLWPLAMALWLLGVSAFQCYPVTPCGVQCPAASVQQVAVMLRDCCGKPIGQISRAPVPGDKGFVQCRCAEKKTAKQLATITGKLEPMVLRSASFHLPRLAAPERIDFAYIQAFSTVFLNPSTRPPTSI